MTYIYALKLRQVLRDYTVVLILVQLRASVILFLAVKGRKKKVHGQVSDNVVTYGLFFLRRRIGTCNRNIAA